MAEIMPLHSPGGNTLQWGAEKRFFLRQHHEILDIKK